LSFASENNKLRDSVSEILNNVAKGGVGAEKEVAERTVD